MHYQREVTSFNYWWSTGFHGIVCFPGKGYQTTSKRILSK